MALGPGREEAGVGGAVVQRGDRVDDLGRWVVLGPRRCLRTTLIARAAALGNNARVRVSSSSMTLIERDSVRPCPRLRRRCPGAWLQGRWPARIAAGAGWP